MNGKDEQKYGKPYVSRGPSEASEASIKTVMARFFRSLNIDADFEQERVVKAWEEITGELIKKMTMKIYLKGGVLYVHVNSPALKSELMMVRTSLCDRLNERLGGKMVKAVYIK